MALNNLLDSFEDDLDGWNADYLTRNYWSSNYHGDYALYGNNEDFAWYTAASHDFPTEVKAVKLWYSNYENSQGGGYEFEDANHNRVAAVGNISPRPMYLDGGSVEVIGDFPDHATWDSPNWIGVTLEFDYSNGEYTITWEGGYSNQVTAEMETNSPVTSISVVNVGTSSNLENQEVDNNHYQEATDYITYDERASPPASPNSPTIEYAGIGKIDVSWTEDTSGGEIVQYRIQRSGPGVGYSTITTTSSTSYTDTDINEDTDYRYRIRAENDTRESSYSYTSTRTSGGSPKSFTVGSTGYSSIDLSWTNPGGDWDSIEIYEATSPGSALSDYSLLTTSSASSHSRTGLTNGRNHYYRLQAIYPDGESDPTEEIVGTTDLPAPTLDSVTPGYRQVDLAWTLNDDNPDGEVRVERDSQNVHTAGLLTTGYTDDGLLDGEQYSYQIVRDTGDATASSETLSDITDLPPVEDLTVDSIDGRFVTLSWTDPSNNANGYRLLLQKPSDGSYSQDGTDIDPVDEGGTVTHETTELLDGQQYDATVETFTADTTAREDQ